MAKITMEGGSSGPHNGAQVNSSSLITDTSALILLLEYTAIYRNIWPFVVTGQRREEAMPGPRGHDNKCHVISDNPRVVSGPVFLFGFPL